MRMKVGVATGVGGPERAAAAHALELALSIAARVGGGEARVEVLDPLPDHAVEVADAVGVRRRGADAREPAARPRVEREDAPLGLGLRGGVLERRRGRELPLGLGRETLAFVPAVGVRSEPGDERHRRVGGRARPELEVAGPVGEVGVVGEERRHLASVATTARPARRRGARRS